ncbi:hypothetical protein GUITHDRAFT_131953 [Guillardia theta CCMP2712]|uniref:Uncharacterized protein n=2 Tax=Guillardia theta TaxID=55529 RepID=L1K3F9_GUITC|nr:hypothetical protein GUITHDRAFT_131953 [Guillardia theta CCMP2712]EKX55000.1 hypothetical protein GUITHDRAFT_131953 [Guillardia theta CCMP2712]|mmetsp:Transcript_4359/g.15916  ORF Transcript_4359/g.15916 Transcript_4359/m.15916 type:complete len:292 (+) Transcript_4359:178-1053(+)|eukprot:XP_005841980.1 hypothetical protein GUITHDRAFT_131953 [Guillardia theta CCMP2712]
MRNLVRIFLSSLLVLLAIVVIPSAFDQEQGGDQLSIFAYFEDLVGSPKSSARKLSAQPTDEHAAKRVLHQRAIARKQISTVKAPSLAHVHRNLVNATNHTSAVHPTTRTKVSEHKVRLTSGQLKSHGSNDARGSEAWERQADDDFFDSLDKNRDANERAKRTEIKRRSESEEEEHQAAERAEEEKVNRRYLDAKRRFMKQQQAAKKYTKDAFARMDAHQAHLRSDSFVGFKSIEAKELAREVERDHPNESASQIAARALKLLHVIMKSRSESPSLPHLDSVGPIGPADDVH